MIPIKTAGEIQRMRAACRVSAELLAELAAEVRPGQTTGELDAFAAARMRARGVASAFLGYGGFPGHTCISLNEEVVHGIPGARVINAGDLVSLDLGVVAEGFIGDNATTVRVGAVEAEAGRLCTVCAAALAAALDAAALAAAAEEPTAAATTKKVSGKRTRTGTAARLKYWGEKTR